LAQFAHNRSTVLTIRVHIFTNKMNRLLRLSVVTFGTLLLFPRNLSAFQMMTCGGATSSSSCRHSKRFSLERQLPKFPSKSGFNGLQQIQSSTALGVSFHHQDTNDSYRRLVSSETVKTLVQMMGVIYRIQQRNFTTLWQRFSDFKRKCSESFPSNWWCFVPVILTFLQTMRCILILNTLPGMPSFWPMTQCFSNHIISPTVIAVFLLSNIPFFVCSAILFRENKMHPTMLPWLVLSAGTISTIYHSIQAMGSPTRLLAEAFCFIDHGVAFTAGLYFIKMCGMPSIATLFFGVSGLGFLTCYPENIYPLLHSVWHLLSSLTILSWANDRLTRRQTFITRELNLRRRAKSLL